MRIKSWMQCIALLVLSALIVPAQSHKSPPVTKTDNVTETIHGVTITDPYRWLEDQNSPETRAWIDSENEYTKSVLNSLPGRDQIHQGLEKLLKTDAIRAPRVRGGRYFFSKRRADQNQFVFYMREGPNGSDQVLLDPNTMSPDQSISVRDDEISWDGKLVIYGIQRGGEDETSISVLDIASHKDLPDHLPRARYGGLSMKPDNSGFYYSRFGGDNPRIYYHAMGTDSASDTEVFGKGYGKADILRPELSTDGRYLIIMVSHGSSGDNVELYMQDLVKKTPITPIVNDIPANFNGGVEGGHFFMQTNWKAPNGRVLDVDLGNPARGHWREVVPESTSVLGGISLVGGRIVARYLENVSTRMVVFDQSGKKIRDLTFPTLGTASGMLGRWDSDEAFYGFASFAQPSTIYRYQVSTGKQEVWARTSVPIDSNQIEVKQVWYESKDKTKIPMFLVYKKGIKLDGNRPTLLTGYGGFNVSLTPQFSALAAFWAESGGVFAEPNLRGGGEFGEKWHRAGMHENKQNVFDDFIAAAEWLEKNGYTRPSRLAISGGSNGGLLVGAAMTQRPELYQAVVCSFPLLDMIRYQNFLVARFWVSEYGSSEDPKQFEYIYRYSPYQHVVKGTKYPAVLFITGDSDTRVAPLHARKMTALVQASTGSGKPVLLHYDTKAGHSGGTPVNKQIDNMTDELNFLFWQLGVPVT
jgi:prolyl oligopeptidase